jgi:hypothetical protein
MKNCSIPPFCAFAPKPADAAARNRQRVAEKTPLGRMGGKHNLEPHLPDPHSFAAQPAKDHPS